MYKGYLSIILNESAPESAPEQKITVKDYNDLNKIWRREEQKRKRNRQREGQQIQLMNRQPGKRLKNGTENMADQCIKRGLIYIVLCCIYYF